MAIEHLYISKVMANEVYDKAIEMRADAAGDMVNQIITGETDDELRKSAISYMTIDRLVKYIEGLETERTKIATGGNR